MTCLRVPVLMLLLALAGCAAVPAPAQRAAIPSPCAGGNEASYACQVERYQNVNVD